MNKELTKILDTIAGDPDLSAAETDALMEQAFSIARTEKSKKECGQYLKQAIAKRKRPDVDVRYILGDAIEALNLSYIAKRYFNKSRTWLYQRLNHSNVNGKPAAFTEQELKILSDALGELSNSIQYISTQLTH